MSAAAKPRFDGHYPRPAPVDAYGNGGFRFAEMSHKGSLLILPSGVWAWAVATAEQVTLSSLARALSELAVPAFLLLGTGRTQVFPSIEVRRAFLEARVGLEPMDTGAAARTFNVLLAEGRPVAAALVAVD
jgi:uncharacterized protein